MGKDLTNSARLGNVTLQAGGYIWLEGFRSEFPSVWTMSNTNGGSTASELHRHLVDPLPHMAGGQLQPPLGPPEGQEHQPAERRT